MNPTYSEKELLDLIPTLNDIKEFNVVYTLFMDELDHYTARQYLRIIDVFQKNRLPYWRADFKNKIDAFIAKHPPKGKLF